MGSSEGLQVWENKFESVGAADLPRLTTLAVWLPDDWLVVPAESVVHGVEADRAADHPAGKLPKSYMAEGAAGDLRIRVSATAMSEGMHAPPESSRQLTGLTPEVRWERRQPGRDPSLRAWLRDRGEDRAATAVLVLASGLSDAIFEKFLRQLRRMD